MVFGMMLHHLLAALVHLFHVFGVILMLLALGSGRLRLGMAPVRVSGRSGLRRGRHSESKRERANNDRLHV
jgi:hypothetical protein